MSDNIDIKCLQLGPYATNAYIIVSKDTGIASWSMLPMNPVSC